MEEAKEAAAADANAGMRQLYTVLTNRVSVPFNSKSIGLLSFPQKSLGAWWKKQK